MNIYIYGNKDFKKEINELIKHSNLRLRMSDEDEIIELASINDLKETILNTPEDIFLIDQAKIFTNNIINKNLKFLKPKDSIDKDFLEQNGIGDLNVDSFKDLKKYLIEKYEENSEDDDEDFDNRSEIENSIINIVDEAYNEDEHTLDLNEADDGEQDDEYLELDDDLSSLLSKSVEDEEEIEIPLNKEEKLEDILNELDKKDDNIIKEDVSVWETKGEEMNIDDLNEEDVLNALSLDGTTISTKSDNEVNSSSDNEGSFNLNLNNADDLARLLKELSQNKTLEITVKVK